LHLHRKGITAVVSQRTAQGTNQAPIWMNAHAVHDEKSSSRTGHLGINRQKLVAVFFL
jgi:hypothetical protein